MSTEQLNESSAEMQGRSSSRSSDGSRKLQLKAYAKVDAEPLETESGHGCIPMMVSITTPPVMAEQRAPVDLVVVLHVRVGCKVPEKWKELLMEAVKVVADKLNDKDRLAVIPSGGSRVSEDPKQSLTVKYTDTLLPMSTKNKESYSDTLTKAIGKCNNSLVRALESADSILYGQGYEDDEERRAGYIIVISNSQDDMGSLLTWRFRSVLAFGFRDARNARTMDTISRSRDSAYAVLDDEHGQVTQAFAASVDRVTSATAAMPVEVKLKLLKCPHKVALSAVDAPHVSYFISYDKEEIWVSAHLYGVVTNFIVYLRLGDLRDQFVPGDWMNLFTLHVKYRHFPDKLDGKVVAVSKGVDGSKEVAAEMVRIKAVNIVAEIIQEDKNDSEQLHEAADMLRTQWTDLENSYRGREAGEGGLISGLAAEMKEMEIRLYNNYLWLEYMLSWKSHQWWQLPLPRLFMDKQAADEPVLRLTISAKVDANAIPGTITEHQQQGLPVPVLVRVVAPEAGLAKEKRATVDLVAVLDASRGPKEIEKKTKRRMEQLKEAMELVMEKLSHKDRLAIVPVQSSVAGHADGLLEMSKQGRSEASAKVQSLVDLVVSKSPTASANNEAAQTSPRRAEPNKAMELVRKWLHVGPINSSIPTSASPQSRRKASTTTQSVAADGRTSLWNAMMHAVQILNDREGTAKDRLGFIIVISDSGDISILQKPLDPEYIIHAFSFYNSDARNTRIMHYIASSSNGIYASLHDRRKQITEAFTACINKITSIMGIQMKVKITCSHSSSIALSAIESGDFSSPIDDDRKSGSILTGALYAGTAKNFMLYVDNVREEDNLSELLAVSVEWLHAFSWAEEKLDGQVDIVKNGSDGSKEVMAHIARAEAGKIVEEIADPGYMAEDGLNKCLKASDKARAAGDASLAREMEMMKALLSRRIEQMTGYARKPVADRLPYMLSWLSFQNLCEQAPSLPYVRIPVKKSANYSSFPLNLG